MTADESMHGAAWPPRKNRRQNFARATIRTRPAIGKIPGYSSNVQPSPREADLPSASTAGTLARPRRRHPRSTRSREARRLPDSTRLMSTTESNLDLSSSGNAPPGAGPHAWTRLAPRSLSRRQAAADDASNWSAWCKHLRRRRKPAGLGKLLAARRSPLVWALPADPGASATADLIERLGRLERRPPRGKDRSAWTTEVENWIWSCDAAVRSACWCWKPWPGPGPCRGWPRRSNRLSGGGCSAS